MAQIGQIVYYKLHSGPYYGQYRPAIVLSDSDGQHARIYIFGDPGEDGLTTGHISTVQEGAGDDQFTSSPPASPAAQVAADAAANSASARSW